MILLFLLHKSTEHLLTKIKTLAGIIGLPATFQSRFLIACKSRVASEQLRCFTIHK